jgi:hypothetical protein
MLSFHWEGHPTSSYRSSQRFSTSFRFWLQSPSSMAIIPPQAQAFRLRFSLNKFKSPRSLTLEFVLFSTRISKMDQTGSIVAEKLIRVDKPSSLRLSIPMVLSESDGLRNVSEYADEKGVYELASFV